MIKGNSIRNLVETKYPIMKENSIFLSFRDTGCALWKHHSWVVERGYRKR